MTEFNRHSRWYGKRRLLALGACLAILFLSSPARAEGNPASGKILFDRMGCASCHRKEDSPWAPAVGDLYGKDVVLDDGTRVKADDAYIKESILYPRVKVVNGYRPGMPSYDGNVTEQQVDDLLAYIKSLARPEKKTGPAVPKPYPTPGCCPLSRHKTAK